MSLHGMVHVDDEVVHTVDLSEDRDPLAAVRIGTNISVLFINAADAERLAQACLDAAALLRPDEPAPVIQRVGDVPSPTADEVTRRLSPWTAAPVLGTAGDGPVVARLHAAEVPGVAR